MNGTCVFCEIVAGRSPSTKVWENTYVLAIVPLGPVVDGHVIFMPKAHARDATSSPIATSMTMEALAAYAERQHRPANLITSIGPEATQSVFHLHMHYVPRNWDDGLQLPWGTNEHHRVLAGPVT